MALLPVMVAICFFVLFCFVVIVVISVLKFVGINEINWLGDCGDGGAKFNRARERVVLLRGFCGRVTLS